MGDDDELDSFDDSSRYDSAIGWEPKDPYEKQRNEARKNLVEYGPTPFEISQANKSAGRAGNRTTGPLYGNIWRRGEVAVMIGDPGISKSVLAMHIAETIARGRAFAEPFAAPRAQSVVYFDFKLTDAQFRERYSVKTGSHQRKLQQYQFSPRLLRASVGEIQSIPAPFKDDIQAYIRYWVSEEAESDETDVFIIDNISRLANARTAPLLIRNLKYHAATNGKSFLILATSREKRAAGELKLSDASAHKFLIEQADSVFALARSTCGEEIRYLKHLKSRTAEREYTTQNVAVLRLERTQGVHIPNVRSPRVDSPHVRSPRAGSPRVDSPHVSKGHSPVKASLSETYTAALDPKNSPPYAAEHGASIAKPEGGVSAALSERGGSLHSQPLTPDSPLSEAMPFLAFTYLGTSPERDHHCDYFAELLKTKSGNNRPKPLNEFSTTQALTKGLLDGSYGKYLNGD